MTLMQLFLLVFYAVGMSLGQIMFKLAAQSVTSSHSQQTVYGRILDLFFSPYFISAIIFYLGLSVLWVWILTFTPLSKAYPFVTIAFVVTPLMSHFLFGELLGPSFYFGLLFILAGLLIINF